MSGSTINTTIFLQLLCFQTVREGESKVKYLIKRMRLFQSTYAEMGWVRTPSQQSGKITKKIIEKDVSEIRVVFFGCWCHTPGVGICAPRQGGQCRMHT